MGSSGVARRDLPAAQPQSGRNVEVPSLRSLSSLIVIECLFTVAGGFLDAYAFIAHGHVFANAQRAMLFTLPCTLLLAIGRMPVRHVPPIVTCVLGVGAAKLLGARSEKQTIA